MKIFKPIGILDEDLVFGVYFKSENDISTHYMIKLFDGRFEGNALVKIYTTDIPDNHFVTTEGLINGTEIAFSDCEIEWIADVDLFGKYFFPKFSNRLQLYYDDERYYGREYKTNSITSLMECVNFAIEYGLNKSGIKPY